MKILIPYQVVQIQVIKGADMSVYNHKNSNDIEHLECVINVFLHEKKPYLYQYMLGL